MLTLGLPSRLAPSTVVVAILPLGATVPGSTSGPTATFPHGRVDLSLTVKAGPELSRYFCNVRLLLCFFLGGWWFWGKYFSGSEQQTTLKIWLNYSPQATISAWHWNTRGRSTVSNSVFQYFPAMRDCSRETFATSPNV